MKGFQKALQEYENRMFAPFDDERISEDEYEDMMTDLGESLLLQEGWSNDPCGICKYKNCLTEIKGIAEENIRIADLEGLNGVYRRGLAKQILQKISEVSNG